MHNTYGFSVQLCVCGRARVCVCHLVPYPPSQGHDTVVVSYS